jgi:hypothetical protein
MSENSVAAAGGGTPKADAPQVSVADIVQSVSSGALTMNERVLIVRALRDSFPELVPVDPRLAGRIRAAQGMPPEFIETTVNALENYEVWQQSASASPIEMRKHREYGGEHRPLIDALQAFVDILVYNVRYQHFVGVEMARTAFKVGKEMSGEAGLSIKPHLEIIAQSRPSNARKRKKAEAAKPAPAPVPVVTPK